MGTDLARVTPRVGGLTFFAQGDCQVSIHPWQAARGALGTCWGRGEGNAGAKTFLLCLAPLSGPALVPGWPPPLAPRQTTAVLDPPPVSACLFKFSGRDMLSQRVGTPVWGSPPEGVSLSLWALSGNLCEKALIPPVGHQNPPDLTSLPVLSSCFTLLTNLFFYQGSNATSSRRPSPAPSNYGPLRRVSISRFFFDSPPQRKPLPHWCSPRAQPKTGLVG